MKQEYSAGGIVYHLEGGRQDSFKVDVLLCQHSQHHGWVFPKGFIGDTVKNESKEDTALREVLEETGVIGKIIEPLPEVTYIYNWEGKPRQKTVYYYIMEYVSGDITQHDWEMENVEWLPIEEVESRLTFDSDKEVWKQARQRILALSS